MDYVIPATAQLQDRNYRTGQTGQTYTATPLPTYGVVNRGRGSLVIAYGTAGHKYLVIAYGMVQPIKVG